jgi:acyl-CoA synthetase (AMP-forming)/AMP-acid ligase II
LPARDVTAGSSENAILAAWKETLVALGDRPAVLAPDGGTLRTFSAIEAEATDCAALLREVAPSSVVAIRLGNSPSYPGLLLALFRRGLIPLPLGQHLEKAELGLALETCGAAALIEANGAGLRIAHLPASAAPPPPDADFLKLTSGTTAAPRAIRFRAYQLVADCDQICASMGLGPDDVNFGVIPFAHSYGFSNLLTPLLCRGIPLVASDDRMPRAILDGLAHSGATVFPGMPLFFQKLAELDTTPALPRLQLCISAGAPLPAVVAARFSERFGLKIHTFYGSSECGGIGYDDSDECRYEDGFAGTPMVGVTITPAEAGRIEIRSAAVGEGYFPSEDAAALGSGRFIPGDLVRWTERGMFIAGRASELINVAGRKLNPAEVEQRLLECPGVRQAVLFAVPSALRGEEAVACVAGEGIDAAGVLRFCREHLSQWQVPRDIWLVPEIAANERGKISRRLLAENYLATRPGR